MFSQHSSTNALIHDSLKQSNTRKRKLSSTDAPESKTTEKVDLTMMSALVEAIVNDKKEIFAGLVQDNKPLIDSHIYLDDFKVYSGTTLLMIAVWLEKTSFIETILQNSVNPLITTLAAIEDPKRSDHGINVGSFAAYHNKNASMKMVLSCLALPQEKREFCSTACNTGIYASSTPLMFASSGGNSELVNLLLEHGADREAVITRDDGYKGWTALSFAKSIKHAKIVKSLKLVAMPEYPTLTPRERLVQSTEKLL